ncbi:MAG: DUF1190 domain-containing protein [Acetobacteraceae bacterium]|nr:DUF1190 domain-containing protein [Acetobacteraceae bacterium]
MKRSAAIRLTLLAPFAAVAGCGEEPPEHGTVFRDVAACAEVLGPQSRAECESAFRRAREAHARTAPRYVTAEACQTHTTAERCQEEERPVSTTSGTTSASSSFRPYWHPPMWGFVVGPPADGGRAVLPVHQGQPLAGAPAGTYFYSGGQPLARADGALGAGARSAGVTSVARGGFGRSAVASAGS